MEETMKTTAAAESAAADPSQDIQPIEMPEGSYCPAVVVMCHPGTLDLMKRIWEERLQNTQLIFIELDDPEGIFSISWDAPWYMRTSHRDSCWHRRT